MVRLCIRAALSALVVCFLLAPGTCLAYASAVGKVQDVANDAANRRTRRVQDPKRLGVEHRHDQNQRSPTSTVSPGLSEVAGGTTKRPDPCASVWVRVTWSRRARGEKPPAMATALSTVMLGT